MTVWPAEVAEALADILAETEWSSADGEDYAISAALAETESGHRAVRLSVLDYTGLSPESDDPDEQVFWLRVEPSREQRAALDSEALLQLPPPGAEQ